MNFDKFDKSHETAKARITLWLSSTEDSNAGFVRLGKWLLETKENPYSFLTEEWARTLSSSENFYSLLCNLYHSMLDDGEICFPVLDGNPHIAFRDRRDLCAENLHEYVGTAAANFLLWGKRPLSDITFLATGDEFITELESFSATNLRRWFVSDAARLGVEHAVGVYQSHPAYYEGIVEDLAGEILEEETLRANRK